MKRSRRAARKRYHVASVVCGVLLLCALLFIAYYYGSQKLAEGAYTSMREEGAIHSSLRLRQQELERLLAQREEEEAEPEPPKSDAPHLENTIDFESLQERNADVYAWIQIPGTLVDYPVLQHPEDDVYYLNHTIDGVSGLPGSIYTESIHPKDFSAPMTVLYGHNMRNDTMFGSLHDYEDAAKLTEAPYVYMYLPDRTLVYQIFAAVRFSDTYLPAYCDYEDESDFLAFVNVIRSSPGNVNTEVEVPYGSRLLTLSTCIGNAPSNRFLVEAVLIDEYEN